MCTSVCFGARQACKNDQGICFVERVEWVTRLEMCVLERAKRAIKTNHEVGLVKGRIITL